MPGGTIFPKSARSTGDAAGRYALDEPETLEPAAVRGALALPRLKRQAVLFGEAELRWADWVETWENDRADQGGYNSSSTGITDAAGDGSSRTGIADRSRVAR